jgi:hypothetical protein
LHATLRTSLPSLKAHIHTLVRDKQPLKFYLECDKRV